MPQPAMPDFLAKSQNRHDAGATESSGRSSRMLQNLRKGPSETRFRPRPENLPLSPGGSDHAHPNSPFLRNADLLVMGNCISQLFPVLPDEILNGRVVMMGCPAVDSFERHVAKFSRICRNANLRRITTLTMEVHCCDGLNLMVETGRTASGMNIPWKSGSRHQRQHPEPN
jgi:hypothetical protein